MSSDRNMIYDLVIAGGGPAGLTAAIYAAREKMRVVVVEQSMCGGEPMRTGIIENYPGFPEGIQGGDLAGLFREQAQKFGAELAEFKQIRSIEAGDKGFQLCCSDYIYPGRSVLIATGGEPKKLGIPGEDRLEGKGVSYCATCDGPLFKDQAVAVIGGGNAAMEEALFLTRFASQVFLVHRRDQFRGSGILEDRLREMKNVELVLQARPLEVKGESKVEGLDVITPEGERYLDVKGVFFYVGVKSNTDWIKGLVELDSEKRIKTDSLMMTSYPGIFAAGDVRSGNRRQISIAAGEGTVATLAIRDYLEKQG